MNSTSTECGTDIYLPHPDASNHYVEVALYGGGIEGDNGAAIWLSMTPTEARWLANRLLDRADSVEQIIPHGNC